MRNCSRWTRPVRACRSFARRFHKLSVNELVLLNADWYQWSTGVTCGMSDHPSATPQIDP